ncbi:MAG: hypothetical protein HWD58_14960 [Bacteroidota bacterium]|nr:MAG: hypothetical protein HWD58_14960 [Bacteroidota bacterium]
MGATTTIPFTTATLSATPVYVRFTPQSAGALTATLSVSGGGLTITPSAALSGTGINPTFPTKLVITSITPSSPLVNTNFDVTIQAQDNGNSPQNVLANTDIQLNVVTGTGSLVGATSGTITAGTNSVTITGVNYSVAENGVVISAIA